MIEQKVLRTKIFAYYICTIQKICVQLSELLIVRAKITELKCKLRAAAAAAGLLIY
jgi:hypothetical protein